MKIFIPFLFFFFQLNVSKSQDTIYLKNPSFEDSPRRGGDYDETINGWFDCGLDEFPYNTPPDIHPTTDSVWGVSKPAHDGNTYLGMVTRQMGTWEFMSQKLKNPIDSGLCYTFSAYLSTAEFYKSATYESPEVMVNFDAPVILLVWAGNRICDKKELIGKSKPVTYREWKINHFKFQTHATFRFITIEAFYVLPYAKAGNGHILVDGLSPIIEIQCE